MTSVCRTCKHLVEYPHTCETQQERAAREQLISDAADATEFFATEKARDEEVETLVRYLTRHPL